MIIQNVHKLYSGDGVWCLFVYVGYVSLLWEQQQNVWVVAYVSKNQMLRLVSVNYVQHLLKCVEKKANCLIGNQCRH